MTDTSNMVRNAAVGTGLSALAGLLGGPVAASVVGFACGLPAALIAVIALATIIWLDPVTGLWLAVVAASAVVGFVYGAIRKPPISLGSVTTRGDAQRVASLQARLAEARAREHALITALARQHGQQPAALPAPAIGGQVSG